MFAYKTGWSALPSPSVHKSEIPTFIKLFFPASIFSVLICFPSFAVSLSTSTNFSEVDIANFNLAQGSLFHSSFLFAHPSEFDSETKPVEILLVGRGAISEISLGEGEEHGTTSNSIARGRLFPKPGGNGEKATLQVNTEVKPGNSDPPLLVAAIGFAAFENMFDFDFDFGLEDVELDLSLEKGTAFPSLVPGTVDTIELSEFITPFNDNSALSDPILLYKIEIEASIDPISNSVSINPTVTLGKDTPFLDIEFNDSVASISTATTLAFDSNGLVQNDTQLFSANLNFSEDVSAFSSEKTGRSSDFGIEPSVPEPLTILGSTAALGVGALLKRKYDKARKKS